MKNILLFSIILSISCTIPAFAGVLVGRVDDFEDGTVMDWSMGGPANVVANVASGGPAGVDDNYLLVSRTTTPFHIGIKNNNEWTGDYLAAGIKSISFDVDLISMTTAPNIFSLRIVIFGPGGAFSSKDFVEVTIPSGWQTVEFGLTRSDLVRVFGSGGGGSDYTDPGPGVDDLTATLSNVEKLLIRNDPGANPTPIGTHPPHIIADIGFDNITAVTGPAPTYDLAWTFDNDGVSSYVLDVYEPNVPFGVIGTDDPTLLLHIDKRYQVTVLNFSPHPFDVLAKGATPVNDVVLLGMGATAGTLESDPDIAWEDNGLGTVTFTMTSGLYSAMAVPDKQPGYRCDIHTSTMRGDFDICLGKPLGDLDGNCVVNLLDWSLFAQNWLLDNAVP
jgi:hypothetical protein